jgi:hypothetical protein
VAIFNTVRTLGVAIFGLLFALVIIGTVASAATGDSPIVSVLVGFVAALVTAACGALFYAAVGWYADSLELLIQISRNTGTHSA